MLEILSILIIVACIGFLIYSEVWMPPRPVKSRVAICVKCKYVVKTGCWALMLSIACRTPNDPTPTNFITGKKEYPKFSCEIRNPRGCCPNFKKKWWKR